MPRSHTAKGRAARDRIVRASERLFAARGYHGTSMRDIAAGVRLPLATVVYHFARKETLYAAVLEEIAAELEVVIGGALAADPRVDSLARALVRWTDDRPGRVMLVMREVLDNRARLARATRFPMAPLTRTLTAFARAVGARQPEIAITHVLGALLFTVAARPTVERIVGEARHRAIRRAYEAEAVELVGRVLAPGRRAPTPRRRS